MDNSEYNRMMRGKWPLSRKTLIRDDIMGLDSVQGYLELAQFYGAGIIFSFNPEDEGDKLHSVYNRYCKLEEDGYLDINWEKHVDNDGKKSITLSDMQLTVKGSELLEKIKKQSKLGIIKVKIGNIFWAILASIITTIVVIKIKGM